MINCKKALVCAVAIVLSLNLFTGLVFAAENSTGTVTASKLNLRSGPSKNYTIKGSLLKGKVITILITANYWYKVKTSNRQIGWVSKDYIKLKSTTTSRGSETNRPTVSSSTPSSISSVSFSSPSSISSSDPISPSDSASTPSSIDSNSSSGSTSSSSSINSPDIAEPITSYSKNFLGVKYVWGGTTPKGFDCSGLVQYVYNKFDITINRVAADQAKQGTYVKKEDLMPCDLVFFDTNGGHNYINHVGMYIGNGKFIHSSSGHGEVIITDITKGFYADAYMTAKRFIK